MSEPEIYDKSTGEVFSIADGISSGAVLSETALVLPEGYSREQWAYLGRKLGGVQRSSMWWLGDWARFGYARKYGGTYEEFAEIAGVSEETVRAARWVAEKFETVTRVTDVPWAHHRAVASLEPAIRGELLAEARAEKLSERQVKALASQAKSRERLLGANGSDDRCGPADLFELVREGRRFGCIYADPPWVFDNQGTRAATGNHYDGLTVDELCALPVRDLVADDAHLHLWTVNAFLFECPKIFDAWGFEFRSTFVWIKPEMGIGNYWRNSHEILLTAVRGRATHFLPGAKDIKSYIECSRGAHSEKPWVVRDFLKRTSPGPHIEMFARSEAVGWTVWGNDIERSLFSRSVAASFEGATA